MRRRFMLIACLTIAACSDAERDAAADADGNGSMTANMAAVADPDAPATIDCKRASGQAEQAICADKELAGIDRALASLAGTGSPDPEWVGERKACSLADDMRQCLLEAYGARIHDLASAKPVDGGMVVGPVAFGCGADELSATFINSDPGAVHLRTGTVAVTLPRVTAASGVKYEGRPEGQPWSFWNKGREATLVRAGAETACAEKAPAS